MSTDPSKLRQSLLELINKDRNEALASHHPSKRVKHFEKLTERIQDNAEIGHQLVGIIRTLSRKNNTDKEVNDLVALVEKLIENNAKLKEQVVDALQDIPSRG